MKIFKNFEEIIQSIPQIKGILQNFYKIVDIDNYEETFLIKARNPDTQKHLVLQSGLHGIEGYVGFAMIYFFVDEVIPEIYKLNDNFIFTKLFDLSFIINANPFGVKNKRRVNGNNVDLNRNFLLEENKFKDIDEKYKIIDEFVNPKKKIKNLYFSYIKTFFNILRIILKIGQSNFKNLLLSGQNYNSHGTYYMGNCFQKETILLKGIYKELFNEKKVENTIFLDIHTGYGPSNQMSIVNSIYMKNKSFIDYLQNKYPLVVSSNTDDFYEIKGDLIDFICKTYPDINFATAFEFGTLGNSIFANIKSIIAVILENQYFFNNLNGVLESKNKICKIGKKIISFYENVFFPKSKKWWDKAFYDFKFSIKLILRR